MRQHKCILLGGPLDGERRVIDRASRWYVVPLRAPACTFENPGTQEPGEAVYEFVGMECDKHNGWWRRYEYKP